MLVAIIIIAGLLLLEHAHVVLSDVIWIVGCVLAIAAAAVDIDSWIRARRSTR